MNWLQRSLFGAGTLPDDLRARLAEEDVRFTAEGLVGSVLLRVPRAPGVRRFVQRQGVSAAVVVTGRRLVVCTGRVPRFRVSLFAPTRLVIDAPLATVRDAYDVTVAGADRLCLAWTCGRPGATGQVELRLRTAHASRITGLLAG